MFYGRFPRYMSDGLISLSPLRILDCPFLQKGFGSREILSAHGLDLPASPSWLFLWWWLKKRYTLSFLIRAGSKRIGFMGLCNLELGEAAEMSLAICDNAAKRRGHGSSAFSLVAQHLTDHSLIEKIRVRVWRDNYAALSFWTKSGFERLPGGGNILVMSKDIR